VDGLQQGIASWLRAAAASSAGDLLKGPCLERESRLHDAGTKLNDVLPLSVAWRNSSPELLRQALPPFSAKV